MTSFARTCLALPNAAFRTSCNWPSRSRLYESVKCCPALQTLEEHFAVIRLEYDHALDRFGNWPAYHEVDKVQRRISTSENREQWRVIFFEAMGRKFKRNRQLMPHTASLLDKIPHVFQAFLSRLDPGRSIPPHTTPYAGYLRYHLPIVVPRTNTPYMLLDGVRVDWTEGKGFLFDDTFTHSVVNQCQMPRTVLIVDVERPMKLLGRLVNRSLVACLRYTHAKSMELRNNEFF
jgi:aspartyl/asparaginyl beta-hydroxylase (cupin superfamily)